MGYQRIVELIEKSSLGFKAELIKSIRPSIQISTKRVEISTMPIGSSRMGGVPDLPPSVEWPSWVFPETGKSHSLDFIAQINLKDLANFPCSEDLPKEGMLYFFYDMTNCTWGFDPKDKGSARTIYYSGKAETLERRPLPEYLVPTHACQLFFDQGWTTRDSLFDPDEDEGEGEFSELIEVIDNFCSDESEHHLLGNANTIQSDMEQDCQLVTHNIYCGNSDGYNTDRAKALREDAKQWKLLLQVDSDENPGWMWGDLGRIYFWIKESDLKACNFDDTWLILQCS